MLDHMTIFDHMTMLDHMTLHDHMAMLDHMIMLDHVTILDQMTNSFFKSGERSQSEGGGEGRECMYATLFC